MAASEPPDIITRGTWRLSVVAAGIVFVYELSYVLGMAWALGPGPPHRVATGVMDALNLFVPAAGITGVIAFVAQLVALLRGWRRGASRRACVRGAVGLGAWAALVFGMGLATTWDTSLRYRAVERTAVAAAPLIEAIKQFEAQQGHAPDDLAKLVPAYIADIPDTDCRACGDLSYHSRDRNDRATWELSVFCQRSIFVWDLWFYWPTEDYPTHAHGGSTVPIDGWAYVHE